MMLNDTELKQKVQRHCGQRIARSEEPCESCKKKLAIAKSIERQKDQAWREHEQWNRQQRYSNRKEYERHA